MADSSATGNVVNPDCKGEEEDDDDDDVRFRTVRGAETRGKGIQPTFTNRDGGGTGYPLQVDCLLRMPGSQLQQKRKIANHFFAIQITDEQIIQGAQTVQQSILNGEPRLQSALVNPCTFHITLAVFHMSNQDEIARANQVLRETGIAFADVLKGQHLQLSFDDVGHFQSKVVYVAMKNHDEGFTHLTNLSKALRGGCQSQGICLVDGDRFTPHLTLLKLSKDPRLRRKGIKSVNAALYESHTGRSFGTQTVESIQLLSMVDAKDERGYYAKMGEFHLAPSSCNIGGEAAARLTAQLREENRSRMNELLLKVGATLRNDNEED